MFINDLSNTSLSSRVPGSVPSSLLVQEPRVAGPQEAVEEAEQDGSVAGAEARECQTLTILDLGELEIISVRFITRRLVISEDPGVDISNTLETEETMSPGRGCRQPDEAKNRGNDQIYLGIVLLFISVEVRVEHVESQPDQEQDESELLNSSNMNSRGEAVEPGDDTKKHEELGVG